MILTPLNEGGAYGKITIHRRADCLCPEADCTRNAHAGGLPQAEFLIPYSIRDGLTPPQ